MIKKVMRIMELAMLVSQNTEHDVFVRYSGHVNSVDIYHHHGGWTEDGKMTPTGRNENTNGSFYLVIENERLLDSAIEQLESMLHGDAENEPYI